MSNLLNNSSETPQNNVLEKFLENQSKKIRLREQQLELRKQTEQHEYEFAKASLEIQERALVIQSREAIKKTNYRYIFIVTILLFVLIFIISALYLNKDQIVLELIKAALYILGGGTGGYYLGRKYSKEEKENFQAKSVTS